MLWTKIDAYHDDVARNILAPREALIIISTTVTVIICNGHTWIVTQDVPEIIQKLLRNISSLDLHEATLLICKLVTCLQ
jgi:flagellar motor component MotA